MASNLLPKTDANSGAHFILVDEDDDSEDVSTLPPNSGSLHQSTMLSQKSGIEPEPEDNLWNLQNCLREKLYAAMQIWVKL